MRIVVMVEGETERAFKPILLAFLRSSLNERMPKLHFKPSQGPLPTGEKLRRVVSNYLSGNEPADHVIWLSDVYPGQGHWTTAQEAKAKARAWVGGEPRFHPHVALHDFEAWLLPYWDRIKALAKSNRSSPGANPETVDHGNPPSYRIAEAFRVGDCKRDYKKPIDAPRILDGQDLMVAIRACPELRAFVNTILRLAGGSDLK